MGKMEELHSFLVNKCGNGGSLKGPLGKETVTLSLAPEFIALLSLKGKVKLERKRGGIEIGSE